MTKTKKLKVTLLMGVIACFIAVFCCMQAAFANDVNSDDTSLDCSANFSVISDSEKPIIGAVRGAYDGFFFRDEKEFEVACFGYEDKDYLKNEKELTIYVHKNFNFHEFTCEIDNNRTFKFVIDQAVWLFSTDAHTMIDVKNGNLILNCNPSKSKTEEDDYYAFISEPGHNTAITVDEGGQVQADHICFREPYERKEGPSKGGIFYFEDLTKDQVFNNCIFDHNKASDGGAIYVDNSKKNGCKFEFNNCEFDSCGAYHDGGAINNWAESVNMEFNHTTFKNCTSGVDGGAIAAENHQQNYTFNNKTVFDSCRASGDGGAIYVYGSGVKFVGGYKGLKPCDYTTFNNCISVDDGGAIYTSGATGKGNDTSYEFFNFFSNEAKKGYGGAIGNHGANTVVNNSVFTNNQSDGAGGAIHSLPTDGICLDSCVFDNNISDEGCNVLCSSTDDFRRSKNNTIYGHGPFSALDAFGQYWEDEDLVGRFRVIVIPND